ncbi:hypothetical protein PMZ80_002522 [Knufia obscura]|uniref:Amino acid transporter transmembrane domain-containing protein n=1 Tax=Knufia obscura TaxID=1635080 RepID=A0ABR0RYL2_9EURO|nr:hypothetical protein PMZ80_002522 [Knufia obscura]
MLDYNANSRSRSPTLRPSADNQYDPEKLPESMQGDPEVQKANAEKRKSSKWQDEAQGDPFGDREEEEGDVKYRTLKWWQCAMIMIAETVSLGVLSLPSVLAAVGMIGGAILIVTLGLIATYSGYVIGQFKVAHPWVHNMADAFHVLFRPLGPRAAAVAREFGGAAQTIFLIFSMASHILTWTICLNTLTNSATCTIVWAVVGLVIFWICDLPRTLLKVSWLSCISFASILTAVLIAMIALGVENPSNSQYRGTAPPGTTFPSAFLAVTNIVFAFAGHVAFFSFISEMQNPKDFPKALVALQITDTTIYFITAMVCYAYAGQDVLSPALGSAGGVVGKIAWGLAIPTIVIAGVIYGHVASKYVYVRIFRGTKHMRKRTWLAVGSWMGITLVLWVVAFIIAESIPNFNDLLALISSLFASWFTYGISGVFWLFINWGGYGRDWRKMCLTVVNVGLVVMGGTICGVGLYASGTAISSERGGGSWTCESNAQY